jgi:amino acid transporter
MILIVISIELTAAGITIKFWREDLDVGIWITVFFVALCIVQIFGVKGYGEGMRASLVLSNFILTDCSRIRARHDQDSRLRRLHYSGYRH